MAVGSAAAAAAWAVDLLARDGQLAEALELAGALREAQDDLDGAELARLSRQRRALVAALATQNAFRGRAVVRSIFLIPYVLPAFVVALGEIPIFLLERA